MITMKNFLLLLPLLLLFSCKKKENSTYSTYISFANRSSYNLEIELYPKKFLLMGSDLYKPDSSSSGYWTKKFKIGAGDSSLWSRHDLSYSEDTTTLPSQLLTSVFDSVIVHVQNPNSSIIKLMPGIPVNPLINPYSNDNLWVKNKILRSTIDATWNGFYYVNVFYIDDKL